MSPNPTLAISNRLRSTPFTGRVKQHGAKAFTVYNHMLLPTEFASLEEDYWHLCEHVQVWDVSAERQVEVKGVDACKLVQWMTPRSVANVDVGRCVYAPLVDEHGFLINDPVALKLADDHWWLSIADSDVLLWAKGLATAGKLNVSVRETDVWPLAVQGPQAQELMARVFGEVVKDIGFFRFKPLPFNGHLFNVARSGWSKQGGFEIYVDDAHLGAALYDALFEAGDDLEVRSGCPNLIERMESSLLSFGNDMNMNHTLLECGLDSFVDLTLDVDSLSIDALRAQQQRGLDRKLVGLAIASPDGPAPAAIDVATNFLLSSHGESIGRLGSQVWSPRYGQQLLTVMLEKAFFIDPDGENTLKIQMDDGSHQAAMVMNLPFDFKAAGILAQQ